MRGGAMTARHRRERQIAEVLARQGSGYLVDALGLEHLRSVERDLLGRRPREVHPPAERLRLTLQELGATFIKLGQFLSTRSDLLAPEYRDELAKLQDAAPPVAPDAVQEAIAHELNENGAAAFATFDVEPLAAASIGQAHAATLRDGTEVVVKVRRPGVVEQVGHDLEILQNLALRASERWEPAQGYDLVGLADEFARTLRAELDYIREGRNAERFAANFASDSDVQIPKVFWETTTSRVITLERIRGLKISDLAALDAAGIDRPGLAQRGTRVVAKMVFDDGFFHADPHPGNFFVEPGGRLGIIDFGMVGTVSDLLRAQLGRLLLALVREDADGLTKALLSLGATTIPTDAGRLQADLAELLGRYSGRGIGDISFGAAIGEILEIARRYRLTMPRDLALLFKTFIMEEGMAADLDPDFQLIRTLAPFAYRQLLAQLSPAAVAGHLERVGVDFAELTADLPDQLHRLLGILASGGFEVHLRAAELQPLMARSERLANRVAVSVLAAAVLDGVADLLAEGPSKRRAPMVFAIFGAVGILSAYAERRQTSVRHRSRAVRG